VLEHRILFDFLKYFPSVFSRQIQIKQDQIGPAPALYLVVPKKRHRFDSVPGDVQTVVDLRVLERLDGESDVSRIVFHEQDVDGASSCHKITPVLRES
jgi:hypothetical protein